MFRTKKMIALLFGLTFAGSLTAKPGDKAREMKERAEEAREKARRDSFKREREIKIAEKERVEKQIAVNKYVGAVQANGGVAPKWAEKSEGAKLYKDINQKFQASINQANAQVAAQGAASGMNAEQIKNLQAEMKKDIRAGGKIAPASTVALTKATNYKPEPPQAPKPNKYDQYSNDNFNDSWKGPLPSQANVDALKKKYAPKVDPLVGKSQAEIQAWAKQRGLSIAETRDLMNEYKPATTTAANPFAGVSAGAGTKKETDYCAIPGNSTKVQCRYAPQIKRDPKLFHTNMYGGPDFYSNGPVTPGGTLTYSSVGITDSAVEARQLSKDVTTGNNAGMGIFGSNTKGFSLFQMGRDIIAGSVYAQAGNKIDCSSGTCKAPDNFYLLDTKIGNKDIELGINSAFILKSGILGEKYPTPNEVITGVTKSACQSTYGTSTCDANGQKANVVLHSNAGTTAVLVAAGLDNAGFQVNNVVGYEARLSKTSDNLLNNMFGANQVTNYSASWDTGVDLKINKNTKVDIKTTNAFWDIIQLGAAMDGGYRPVDGYVQATNPFVHHEGSQDGHKVPTNVIQTLKDDLNTPPKSSQPQVNYCPGTTQPAPKKLELPKNFDPSKIFVPKIKVVTASSVPDLPDFNPASLNPQ